MKMTNKPAKRLDSNEMTIAYAELESKLLAVKEMQDFKAILDSITPLHQKDKDNLLPLFSAMSISFRKAQDSDTLININEVYSNAKKHIANNIMNSLIEKNTNKQESYTVTNKNKSICVSIFKDILNIKEEQDFSGIISQSEEISNKNLKKDIDKLITFTRVHLFVSHGNGDKIDPARALQKAARNIQKTHMHKVMKEKNKSVSHHTPAKKPLLYSIVSFFKGRQNS